jgi:hypothetical protein
MQSCSILVYCLMDLSFAFGGRLLRILAGHASLNADSTSGKGSGGGSGWNPGSSGFTRGFLADLGCFAMTGSVFSMLLFPCYYLRLVEGYVLAM